MEISRYYRYRNCLKRNDNSSETNYFNLGTNDLNTVKKVTEKTIPVEIKPRRAGDPASLVADNNKAKEILKWLPEHLLEESIKTAYQWEKNKNNLF